MRAKKPEINFKEYESVDALDKEEQALFNHLQEGGYQSVMTDELKDKYVAIFTENFSKKDAELNKSTIPKNERWLYQGDNLKNLDEAIEWSESHPRRDDFDEIAENIEKSELSFNG